MKDYIKEETSENGLSTRRYVNKKTLLDLASIFKKSKKTFFNRYELDGYTFNIHVGMFSVSDSDGNEIASFTSSGTVLSTDMSRVNRLLNFIDTVKQKQELENTLDNKVQLSIRKLKI